MERHNRKTERRDRAMDGVNGHLHHSSPVETFSGLHQKLVELKEEKKAIIEKSGDAIFVVHPVSGEIFEANHRAAVLTGYKVCELQGTNLEHIIPDQKILSKTVEFYSLNGNGGLRAILRRKDGASIPVNMSACPIHRGQASLQLIFIRKPDQGDLSHSKSGPQSFAGEPPASADGDAPEPIYEFPNIIGKSEQIRKICQRIGQVARAFCTVLVLGESGTGKEIVAQAIHYHSPRSHGPFVKVNCAALSETLLESELFGHVKGAFTGAIQDRKGRFMQADGGTIFLDEIACMSLSGQAKLLRVLEEREFEPLGGSHSVSVNVRVIAASNVNLEKAVAENKFREDLYYRLNVFTLYMPPLREKKEDIPLLAQHFIRKYNLAIGKKIRDLAPETLTLMMQYDWPGNVRELKNAMEHAVIVAKGPVILPPHLPSNFTMPGMAKESINFSTESSLRDRLNTYEKQIVQEAIARANGVKKHAAALLQVDPRNFAYLLRKHNLL